MASEKRKKYMKEYNKKYKQENKEEIKEYNKKWRNLNPEKVEVHNRANYYLKHFKKPGYEFHHPDYNQLLLVEVLPITVHKQLHRQLNKIGGIQNAT